MLIGGRGTVAYRLRLAVVRRRRVVTAALLAAAVAAGLQALRPPDPPRASVLVAARDLPAGHRLTLADVAIENWYPAAVPDGTLPRPAGRVLTSAIRRGEPLTDTRVLGDRLLAGLPAGTVAVTVRLADPASALVVRAGERADVLAGPATDPLGDTIPAEASAAPGDVPDPAEGSTPDTGQVGAYGSSATVVVRSALVLATPSAGSGTDPDGGSGLLGSLGDRSGTGSGTGTGSRAGVLLLAVTSADAVRLAAVAGRRPLTVALHDAMSR